MNERIESVVEGLRERARRGSPTFTGNMVELFRKTLDSIESGDDASIRESAGALGCDRTTRGTGPNWVYGPWHLANAVVAKDAKAVQRHILCAQEYAIAK